MYSAQVQSWIEILFVGPPLPAPCGAAAVAVPVAPRLTPIARTAATRPRTMRPRLHEVPMTPPDGGVKRGRCPDATPLAIVPKRVKILPKILGQGLDCCCGGGTIIRPVFE